MKNMNLFGIALILMSFIYAGSVSAQETDYPQNQQQDFPQTQQHHFPDDHLSEANEIRERDIPDHVKNAIEERYDDYDIEKAWRGADGSYTVKLEKGGGLFSRKDKEVVGVVYDADGQFKRNISEEELDVNRMDRNRYDREHQEPGTFQRDTETGTFDRSPEPGTLDRTPETGTFEDDTDTGIYDDSSIER
jgi:hypothetical protein